MRISEFNAGGPMARYSDAHIYFALHVLMSRETRISRKDLADAIGVGEGSLRTIISSLKDWDLITISRSGIAISDVGKKFYKSLKINLVDVPQSSYVVGAYQRGILIPGASNKITNGVAQRDIAIITGADGASIFVMKDGDLRMPPSWDMGVRDPEFVRSVLSTVDMQDDDVLVISGARDSGLAALTAISVGLGILRCQERRWSWGCYCSRCCSCRLRIRRRRISRHARMARNTRIERSGIRIPDITRR